MPTYDYECTACGHGFEAFQGIHDPVLTECPVCGKKVRRLIGGGAGIVFKGSGFYVTDSRKGKSGGGSKKAKSSTSSDGTASTSTAESSGSSNTSAEAPKSSAGSTT